MNDFKSALAPFPPGYPRVLPGNRRQVPILHRDADFLLRALQPDDFVRTSRYENANREHLAPWEPLRDPGYFSVDNARARTLLQVASMDEGEALLLLLLDPDDGEVLGALQLHQYRPRGIPGLPPGLFPGRCGAGPRPDGTSPAGSQPVLLRAARPAPDHGQPPAAQRTQRALPGKPSA